MQSFIVLASLVFELAGGQNDPQYLTLKALGVFSTPPPVRVMVDNFGSRQLFH